MSALRFPIRVRAGARRETVGGQREGRYGPALVVAVTAPAAEGRANEAVRRALAAELGVRPSAVRLVSGERARDKLVEVDPVPPGTGERLDELRAGRV